MFDSYRETTLRYYPDRCINCRRCTEVCPHGVFAAGELQVELVRPAACMECGACALNCPVQAIGVQSGVGCAWAMIAAALRGKDMDSAECSCGSAPGSCCSGNDQEAACCASDSEVLRDSSCRSGVQRSSCCSAGTCGDSGEHIADESPCCGD